MTTEANKALVWRAFDLAWNRGSIEVEDPPYAPDWVGHVGGGAAGLDVLKQVMLQWRTAFPDMRLECEEQIAEGDKVATRWAGTATHAGPFMGVAPTGKPLAIAGHVVDRVANGKIVESWFMDDIFGLLKQIGALPPMFG